ncbi:endonuclease/exonuclease/phosphatase family protein [Nocardioides sp. Soil777]|uniref:endonuclease/exonuclease/phosphatase family protein n=1 Tax=Nocardioides sp. Soil777 TaxID=1736409 RepID=UPI000AC538A3|nr:endonuclease/exonuclease/phosphatase family protein [Nocardioides sp. Soil777]
MTTAMTPRPLLLLAPTVILVLLGPVLLVAMIAGTRPTATAGCTTDDTNPDTAIEAIAGVDLTTEQVQVATQAVAAVRGYPATRDTPRAAVVVLAAGYQESRLRNLAHGDRDSLGYLQQRPSQGWGSAEQVRDVTHATTSFLTRLVAVPGWQTMRVTDAAAAVQRPADEYRDAYEQWGPLATALTARLWGAAPSLTTRLTTRLTNPLTRPSGAPGPRVYAAPPPPGADGGASSLTIAHANIKASLSPAAFRADLQTTVAGGADLVSLNEMTPRGDREITPPGYAAFRAPPTVPASQTRSTAVLWRTDRWSLVAGGRELLVPDGPQRWDAGRSATWATLQDPHGRQVSMVSVHHMINPAVHGPNPLRQRLYTAGMSTLAAVVTRLAARGPVFVAGDFNSQWSAHDPWGPRSVLADIGMQTSMDLLGREPTHRGGGTIDYVFYPVATATPTAQSTRILNSDHRLMTATFTWHAAPTTTASPACVPPTSAPVPADCAAAGGAAEAGLTPDALRVMRCVLTVFGPHTVGGLGDRPNPSDHETGRAVDIMIDRWDTAAGNEAGWAIARWVRSRASELGVTYVIFDAHIWSPDRDAEGWRTYSHPTGVSSPTLDHLDHVHVSVHGHAATTLT